MVIDLSIKWKTFIELKKKYFNWDSFSIQALNFVLFNIKWHCHCSFHIGFFFYAIPFHSIFHFGGFATFRIILHFIWWKLNGMSLSWKREMWLCNKPILKTLFFSQSFDISNTHFNVLCISYAMHFKCEFYNCFANEIHLFTI